MRKKLIVTAVASTFALPALSQADATWYGRINTALSFTDSDNPANDNIDVQGIASRFGVRGSTDLGNGLSGVYRYEFGVLSDNNTIQDNNRLSFVGLSGDFGTLTLGRIWSATFNHVGTNVDLSQWIGGDALVGTTYRVGNALSYSNSGGPLSFQIDIITDGGDDGSDGADEWQVGATYSGGPLTLAVGYRDVDNSDNTDADVTAPGISAKFAVSDNLNLHAGYNSVDDDTSDDLTGTMIGVSGSSGDLSWYATYEQTEDDDAAVDTSHINLNVYKSLGGGAAVWAELALNSNDETNVDTNQLLLGVRADF